MLAAAFFLSAAHACSCAGVDLPDAARCAASKRAFAATVTDLSWPRGLDYLLGSTPVPMRLSVDRVYRGEVPSTVTAAVSHHPGGCGLPLPPGTTVFVCDDREGAAPVVSTLCSGPARLDHADEVEAGLRLWGHTPRAPTPGGGPPIHLPSWLPATVVGSALVGVAGFLFGRRTHSGPARTLRLGRLLLAVLGAATTLRLIGHVGQSVGLHWRTTILEVGLSVAGLAVLLTGLLTFGLGRGLVARTPRNILAACLLGPLLVALAHVPLVLPIDRPDAVQCSVDRARDLLADAEPISVAVAREPKACTWWGTEDFTVTHWSKLTPEGCLQFTDRKRQVWQVCAGERARTVWWGRSSPWD